MSDPTYTLKSVRFNATEQRFEGIATVETTDRIVTVATWHSAPVTSDYARIMRGLHKRALRRVR